MILGIGIVIILLLIPKNVLEYEQVTVIVLWFTAVAILQYTRETRLLRQVETKNLKFHKAPFVIIHYEEPSAEHNSSTPTFILKNVGHGTARNVTMDIIGSQLQIPEKTVISSDGGYTRIRAHEYKEYHPQDADRYRVIIRYQNSDGNLYKTELQSGRSVDDFEVLYYGED